MKVERPLRSGLRTPQTILNAKKGAETLLDHGKRKLVLNLNVTVHKKLKVSIYLGGPAFLISLHASSGLGFVILSDVSRTSASS